MPRARAACLLLVAALWNDGCGGPRPLEVSERLLDRLEEGRIEWRPGPRRQPVGQIEGGATRVRLRLHLAAPTSWRRLPPDAASFGRPTGDLDIWHLPLALPTVRPLSVEVESRGEAWSFWPPATAATPGSCFYSPGGFVASGLFLALPRGADPNGTPLTVRFAPTQAALVDHLAAAGATLHPPDLALRATAAHTTRPALYLPPRAVVTLPLVAGPAARLQFALARAEPPSTVAGSDAILAVDLLLEGERLRLWSGSVADPVEDWTEVGVDLPERGGPAEVSFALTAEGGGEIPGQYLADPTVAVPATGRDLPPNLLVVVVDGLRADRVEGQEDLPRLATFDRLARRGALFTQARSAAPWTRPSIASLFTGRPPAYHGVQTESVRDVLPATLPTLAEELRRRGFVSAGFSANLHLAPAFGLQRGFDSFHALLQDGRPLVDRAVEWLESEERRPFLLFVFLVDTHYPFPHRPEFDRSSAIAAELPPIDRIGSAAVRRRERIADLRPDEFAKLAGRYEENVRYSDAALSELLAALARRREERGTITVVTADHGEAFGEHGDFFHGWNLYDELVRVPLVLAGPGVPVRRREEAPVSLVDLPGTLLRLAGVSRTSLPHDVLLTDLEGRRRPLPVQLQTRFRGANLAALVRWPYKAIWSRSRPRQLELYDLSRDPAERQDLRSEHPDLAAGMRHDLARWLEAQGQAAPAPGVEPDEALDAQTLESLRALGYVQ